MEAHAGVGTFGPIVKNYREGGGKRICAWVKNRLPLMKTGFG